MQVKIEFIKIRIDENKIHWQNIPLQKISLINRKSVNEK